MSDNSAPLCRRLSPPAPRRSDDLDHLAYLQFRLIAALQRLQPAIEPAHAIAAEFAEFAAIDAEARHAPPTAEDRQFHRLAEADAPQRTVAGAPKPLAAGAAADVEFLQHHGKAALQHFGVGQPRVRHMHMHAAGAIEPRPRRRAGADRLVILIAR